MQSVTVTLTVQAREHVELLAHEAQVVAPAAGPPALAAELKAGSLESQVSCAFTAYTLQQIYIT